jgi:Ca2+-binding EF-hand superfamily protein
MPLKNQEAGVGQIYFGVSVERRVRFRSALTPMTLRRLFANADKSGDGKVTKDEAKGHLPITYLSFEEIDTDKRGWITFEQFMAFTSKRDQKLADDILTQGDKY